MDEPLVSDVESANIDDPTLGGGGNPYMQEEPPATDEQVSFADITESLLDGDLAFLLCCYCCFLSLFLIAEREEVRDQTEI